MDATLHSLPRMSDVIREQIRVVGLSLRREALVVAIVLVIVTLRIALDIVQGTAASWFDTGDWAVIGIASFLFPFAVWRRDRQFGPAFLWTLPVDRRRLSIAKVFAGWVWLMAALAVFVLWHLALALLSGVPDPQIVSLTVFSGTTAMYLLGSAVVLGLRHPLRWLLGTVAVLALLGMLEKGLAHGPWAVETLVTSTEVPSALAGAWSVWQSLPALAQWAILTILWLGAGLLALRAAASRHAESRRY
jgi:hypothetical protein